MKKFQWVVYGLDMFGYVIIETDATDINEAHEKAIKLCKENGLDFDTVESFDLTFINRMKWLNK